MSREEFEERMEGLFEEAGMEVTDNAIEAESIAYMQLITSIEEEFEIELPDQFLVKDSLKNIELFKSLIFELIQRSEAEK